MLRWMGVLLVWISASASAQAPSAVEPAPTDAVEPTDGLAGEANVSAETEPDPPTAGSEATPATESDASASDVPAAELGATSTIEPAGAASGTTARSDSAVELTGPIAPPPPPVGFDDERAERPREEPRPRSALRERFVIFTPGWMPIVTLGYRAQIVRYRGGGVSSSDTSHGLTSGVLAPVLATGDSSSRVRLALGVGMGLDVAWRSESAGEALPGGVVVTDGDDPVYESPGYVERTLQFYGQVAALAHFTFGRMRLSTSLAWLPTRRIVRVQRDDSGFSIASAPSDYSSRALERFRFNVGLTRSAFHVAVFAGGAAVLARGSAREVELGLQLGFAR